MNPLQFRQLIERALAEDLGSAGDLTTDAVVGPGYVATAALVARRAGTIAGLEVAAETFRALDPSCRVEFQVADGDGVAGGTQLASIHGSARAILTGERTALNLLGRMCGIATATAELVAAVQGTGAAIAETRKTTPGLRVLDKYAVRMGGGRNHRFGLDDAVMIKDNHVAVAGGVREAVDAVRATVGHTVTIEVEVDTLDQLAELLEDPVDIVLLDNMSLDDLRAAVRMVDGAMVTEASGGVTPDSVRAVAETGVDVISLGWLTHSTPALDVALDIS